MQDSYYFKTEQMTVGYGGKPLIKDIEIKVKKGGILTLIGPNGSGKSTILKSITKHLAIISGVVYIGEESLNALSHREMATRMSVVLTERIQPEMMTCGDVVASGRYPYTNNFGKLTEQDERIVNEALAKVRAEDLKNQEFAQISDGQRQRIMLARAICQEPEVIVLDEPTSFLDIRHKIELLDILRDMSMQKHITVIMSLHEIDLAHKISDVVVCVKGETIGSYGSPDEIFTEEKIRELYEISGGTYNMRFGSVELSKPAGTPKGFVIAGAGYGANIFRHLQKMRIPFSTGILHENDIDYEIARVLASEVYVEKAFRAIGNELYNQAADGIGAAKWVIDAGTPVGEFNKQNGALLSLSESLGIPIYKSAEDIAGGE